MTPLVYTNAAFDTTAYIRHLIYVMNNIRFIFIILALLQLVGCQKAPKTGEAFIVLNSGDIQYMADMPVLGFNENLLRIMKHSNIINKSNLMLIFLHSLKNQLAMIQK